MSKCVLVLTLVLSLGAHALADDSVSILRQELDQITDADKVSDLDRVNLIIASDPSVTPDALIARYMRRQEKFLPGYFLVRRVRSLEELYDSLKLHPSLKVQSLTFLGIHGARWEDNMDFTITDESNMGLFFSMAEIKKEVELQFLPNALVLFQSCQIMPDVYSEKVDQSFREIADALGMKSGWIYGNYTDGVDSVELMLATPFYEDLGDKKMIQRLAAQSIWYLMLPFYSYIDHKKLNKGYLYGFHSEGQKELVVDSHFYDARKGQW